MKELIKVFLIISCVFAMTFVVIKLSGVLSVDQIKSWLIQAKELSPFFTGAIVVLLLFADLFIAVPTLTITILAGYFLGHMYGALFAFIGMMSAGMVGYILSSYYGDKILNLIIKDKDKQKEVVGIFKEHGFMMILLSRAMPIIPETTACLSGISAMPFLKFLSAWMISSIPYVLIASYAGSISTLENPKPAIFTAIGITSVLWIAWYFFHKKVKSV